MQEDEDEDEEEEDEEDEEDDTSEYVGDVGSSWVQENKENGDDDLSACLTSFLKKSDSDSVV